MQIISEADLDAYAARKAYSGAKRHLALWVARTRTSRWRSFTDVRATFRRADYADGLVIFDIHGNRFRLVTRIDYGLGTVRIVWFGTHAEYDREV